MDSATKCLATADSCKGVIVTQAMYTCINIHSRTCTVRVKKCAMKNVYVRGCVQYVGVHTSLASLRSHFFAELALVSVSRVVNVCKGKTHCECALVPHGYHASTKKFASTKKSLPTAAGLKGIHISFS